MTPGRLVLVGGGVRSGKSAFALELARRCGDRRVFIATARLLDDEMCERARRHREERGTDFETIEEPLQLAPALMRLAGVDVVVIDCLTLWLANRLTEGDKEEEILAAVADILDACRRGPFTLVLVTNEVGMGVHPETVLGRQFGDLIGRCHQRLAPAADEIYFAALGSMLRLHPAPVALVRAQNEERVGSGS
jgi:adenosylcobinamide kinase/adenosylcobinamide-phosphate guanylyltransferase